MKKKRLIIFLLTLALLPLSTVGNKKYTKKLSVK